MPARHIVGNSATVLAGVTLNSALQQNLALEQAAPIGGRRRAHCCRPGVHQNVEYAMHCVSKCTESNLVAERASWLPMHGEKSC